MEKISTVYTLLVNATMFFDLIGEPKLLHLRTVLLSFVFSYQTFVVFPIGVSCKPFFATMGFGVCVVVVVVL